MFVDGGIRNWRLFLFLVFSWCTGGEILPVECIKKAVILASVRVGEEEGSVDDIGRDETSEREREGEAEREETERGGGGVGGAERADLTVARKTWR